MTQSQKNVMYVSNDLGYGDDKGKFGGVRINQPTVFVRIYESPSFENVDWNSTDELDARVKSIFNYLDVSIKDKRYLTTVAAANSLKTLTTLKDDAPTGKAHSDAALIIPLSLIAGRAIQEAYAEAKKNETEFDPDEVITVNVYMTTALPITEAGTKDNDIRPEYKQRFMAHQHSVTVHSLGKDIQVNIKFKDATIFKEGEIVVVMAIQHGPADFQKKLINKVKHVKLADGLVFNDDALAEGLVKDADSFMGIDAGQHTVDISLFNNGSVNDYSQSINQSMGDVLDDAFNIYQQQNPNGTSLTTSKDFNDIWLRAIEPEKEAKSAKERLAAITEGMLKKDVIEAVDQSVEPLINQILIKVRYLISKNPKLQIIFIFGGASIPLIEQYHLDQRIQDEINAKKLPIPVVWVGKEYAQNMNEMALELFSEMQKARQK
ncbi:hypothetical protein [Lactobacillus crispatus]|uniref:hypothetical protein n=1 Tax=Lactobacillus crispatus TaxID=47770 RepID=UPI0029C2E4D4|nr:hypothetical protein [Lactobacillus crispatus]MDX5114063.1 hypothetical protein [Lactobacillus crispatus]MDX5121256.1 hypothetical protein [Lactobacillus crispatus]MDX5126999.1 hypothetical protein [Lactobacillus crispatus]MDX5136046.1 hypothetical protein [Lactobacillus crispatus]